MTAKLENLRAFFPWPDTCPGHYKSAEELAKLAPGAAIASPDDLAGWLQQGTMEYLVETLPDLDEMPPEAGPVIVVELGTWKGLSTNFLVNYVHHVITVDSWQGGPEFAKTLAARGETMEDVHNAFLRNLWYRREDVTFLKMDTVTGLQLVHQAEIDPYLIYIDANHEYAGVSADLEIALSLFPGSFIVGDDWNWPGEDPGNPLPVQRAVKEAARRHGRTFTHNESAFRFGPEGAR